MTKIIINADDLGLNSVVNSEIERFIQDGLITSATLMANGEALEDAIRIAKTYNSISFGVHLCLDEFSCVTKSEILVRYGVVDKDFIFTRYGLSKIKKPTIELKNAIADEIDAQIKVFYTADIKISHIDGHHHCHTKNLWVLDVIINVTKKYDINIIRKPMSNRFLLWRENYDLLKKKTSKRNKNSTIKHVVYFLNTMMMISARVLFNFFWIKKANRAFKTSDKFYSYLTFYHNLTKLKPLVRNKTIELMCHPGHPNYIKETELIKSRVLDDCMYEYLSYKQLN